MKLNISQDQLVGLVRQVLPIIGTTMVMLGVSAATATALTNMLLEIAGPMVLIWSVLWSYYSNSRSSIITSASKSINGEPPPIIILQPSEQHLADELPDNVTTTNETRVVKK